MLTKKLLIFLSGAMLVLLVSCKSSNNGRYKGAHSKVNHHHGFFSVNDKATRKNEKFKKKTSKAGDNKKTSAKTVKASKTKTRTSYVKTFDHH